MKIKYRYHYVISVIISIWCLYLVYPVYYSLSIIKNKREQKEIIASGKRSDDYKELTLDAETFRKQYHKHDHELKFEGRYYDIISFYEENGIVYCTVLYDHFETKIDGDFFRPYKTGKKRGKYAPFTFSFPFILSWRNQRFYNFCFRSHTSEFHLPAYSFTKWLS